MRIGHWPIARGEPIDMTAEQMAIAIVTVDVWFEPGLAVHVEDRLRVERPYSRQVGGGFQQVHMAHFPGFGAYTRAAIGFALNFRRVNRMHRGQHFLFAQEFVEVLLGLGVKAGVVIRIPGMRRTSVRGHGRTHDRFVQAA